MTFAIMPPAQGETIHKCTVWPAKDGKTPSFTLSLLDVRLVDGNEGVTVYAKVANHTGDVLFKKDKESKFAPANDFQGRITFSVGNDCEILGLKAMKTLLKVVDFSSGPQCVTLAIGTDKVTEAYALRTYTDPMSGQKVELTDDKVKILAANSNSLSFSPYVGESLFKNEELVSRKGDKPFEPKKTPMEYMDDRIACLDELAKRHNPDATVLDCVADDLFYRYASLVIR